MAQQILMDKGVLPSKILKRLNFMREKCIHGERIVVKERKSLYVHRHLLIGASSFFSDFFPDQSKQTKSKFAPSLSIDIDYESAKICIDCIYGQDVTVTPDQFEKVIQAAKFMRLNEIVKAMERIIIPNLRLGNVLRWMTLSELNEYPTLMERCLELSEEYFGRIRQKDELLEIGKQCMLCLFKSEKIKLSEEEKLDLLLNWVRVDVKSRKSEIHFVMSGIDVSQIRLDRLDDLIQTEKLIQENFVCMKKVSLAAVNIRRPHKPENKDSDNCDKIMLFEFTEGDSLTEINLFHPLEGHISKRQIPKCEIAYQFSVAHIHGHIYLMGKGRSACRLKWTDSEPTWETMPRFLFGHGILPPVAVLGDHIYIIGDDSNNTLRCERFHHEQSAWETLPDKPTNASFDASAFGFEGCVYSIGGLNKNSKFDAQTARWSDVAPLNEWKSFPAVTQHEGSMLVAGGPDGLLYSSSVERYNAETDQWTILLSMENSQGIMEMHSVNGCLFSFRHESDSSVIEKYDEGKRVWRVVTLPTGADLKASMSLLVH